MSKEAKPNEGKRGIDKIHDDPQRPQISDSDDDWYPGRPEPERQKVIKIMQCSPEELCHRYPNRYRLLKFDHTKSNAVIFGNYRTTL